MEDSTQSGNNLAQMSTGNAGGSPAQLSANPDQPGESPTQPVPPAASWLSSWQAKITMAVIGILIIVSILILLVLASGGNDTEGNNTSNSSATTFTTTPVSYNQDAQYVGVTRDDRLVVMNDEEKVTTVSLQRERWNNLSVAPSGNRVAILSTDEGDNRDLYLFDLPANSLEKITDFSGQAIGITGLVWLDDDRIGFTQGVDNVESAAQNWFHIYTIPQDELRKVFVTEGKLISWDSQELMFWTKAGLDSRTLEGELTASYALTDLAHVVSLPNATVYLQAEAGTGIVDDTDSIFALSDVYPQLQNLTYKPVCMYGAETVVLAVGRTDEFAVDFRILNLSSEELVNLFTVESIGIDVVDELGASCSTDQALIPIAEKNAEGKEIRSWVELTPEIQRVYRPLDEYLWATKI